MHSIQQSKQEGRWLHLTLLLYSNIRLETKTQKQKTSIITDLGQRFKWIEMRWNKLIDLTETVEVCSAICVVRSTREAIKVVYGSTFCWSLLYHCKSNKALFSLH